MWHTPVHTKTKIAVRAGAISGLLTQQGRAYISQQSTPISHKKHTPHQHTSQTHVTNTHHPPRALPFRHPFRPPGPQRTRWAMQGGGVGSHFFGSHASWMSNPPPPKRRRRHLCTHRPLPHSPQPCPARRPGGPRGHRGRVPHGIAGGEQASSSSSSQFGSPPPSRGVSGTLRGASHGVPGQIPVPVPMRSAEFLGKISTA